MTLGSKIELWAQTENTIAAVVMIGSRVRDAVDPGHADAGSDWDFQIISSRPAVFLNSTWLASAGINPLAYVVRQGRLGAALKVSVVSNEGELDLIIIPTWQITVARFFVAVRLRSAISAIKRGLDDLALVQRAGFRVVKGRRSLSEFFHQNIRTHRAPRLHTDAAIALAEGFVCDYISTRKKIERGELIAAQRWLHHYLADTNLRLLHELALQRRITTFPDGRRLEFVLPGELLPLVSIETRLERECLETELERVADSCRTIMHELVGDKWRWPLPRVVGDLRAICR